MLANPYPTSGYGNRLPSERKADNVMSDESGQARGTGQPGDDAPTAAGRFGRRALMLGAAATGAGVAATMAGGGIAEAAPDGPSAVLLGRSNSAHGSTQVITKAGNGLLGQTSANGQSGVVGFDTSTARNGHGLYGHSIHGFGVRGISQRSTGVVGQGSTVGQSGVAGIDLTPTTGAHGLFGQSQHGDALFATSTHGVAVRGQSAHGLALHVQGKAKFSHSGVATIASGHKSVTVNLPGVTASNIVLATIQNPQDGISMAGAQAGSGSFTIMLNKSSASSVKVGWMVLD
jgi:hypothetical protein